MCDLFCRTIDRRKRLIIAMDAAFGMEYLHEKSIVHFDLKSHNFLVNMRDPQRPVCKVSNLRRRFLGFYHNMSQCYPPSTSSPYKFEISFEFADW